MPKAKKLKAVAAQTSSHHLNSRKPSKQASKPHIAQASPTIPFDPLSRILLVGEGDFSFARAIVKDHGCCDVTATCLDSQSELFAKYAPQAEEHVSFLQDEGQTVVYGVDATKLEKSKQLKRQVVDGETFDVIIFNFPHVGGKSTDVNRQVRFNQELLVNFFKSCVPFLAERSSDGVGTVVVTLFEGEPYSLWNIRDLARHSGLEVVKSFRFVTEAYPGYRHSRTLGNIEGGGGWKGEDREARSYVFRRKAPKAAAQDGVVTGQNLQSVRKRRRSNDDSDDDDVR